MYGYLLFHCFKNRTILYWASELGLGVCGPESIVSELEKTPFMSPFFGVRFIGFIAAWLATDFRGVFEGFRKPISSRSSTGLLCLKRIKARIYDDLRFHRFCFSKRTRNIKSSFRFKIKCREYVVLAKCLSHTTQ